VHAAAQAEVEAVADPKAEARAAAARERNRQDREASILKGLDDLDIWLSDQAERGLAVFSSHSVQSSRTITQRLVDAKASGLAARIEGLPGRLFSLPEPVRPAAAIEELGAIYLLSSAYRRQDTLPAALKADVRQAIGWSVTREALLDDPDAIRVQGTWRVVAAFGEVQPDRLRRLETWLWLEKASESIGDEAPQNPRFGVPLFGVLIDFVPVATGAASGGYSVGDRIEAELVFYPSSLPLRAQIVRALSGAQTSDALLQLPEQNLDSAYKKYEEALCLQPWLSVWPLCAKGARVRRSGEQLFLCGGVENATSLALPIRPSLSSMAGPLAMFDSLDAVGLWDGYYLNLCWAQTALGVWVNA
jgi:hypothetical protein